MGPFLKYNTILHIQYKPKERLDSSFIEVDYSYEFVSLVKWGLIKLLHAVAVKAELGIFAEAFRTGPTVEPTDGPCSHV